MTFRIGKYKDLIVPLGTFHNKIGGEFRVILRDLQERVLYDSGWRHNLILDQGLDRIANASIATYGHIGSSSTPAAVTDTTLGSELARSNSSDPNFYYQDPIPAGPPDYYNYKTQYFRFNAGVGTGTVREVGCGTTPDTLIDVRHVLGTPIVKAAQNVLDVYYRYSAYPDLTDDVGQVTLDGVLYDYTGRAADVGLSSYQLEDGRSAGPVSYPSDIGTYRYFTDGMALGSITGLPTGGTPSIGLAYLTKSTSTYVASNHYLDFSWFIDLDGANDPSGFRGLVTPLWLNYIQYIFSANSGGGTIPKTNTKTLSFTWRVSWSRH